MISVQVIGITKQLKQIVTSKEKHASFLDDEIRALNTVEKTKPAVILLDYNLRNAETSEYIKLLLNVSEKSKIVVIADGLRDKEIFACLTAGAKGYQEIKTLSDYVVKMVKVVDAGEAWITRRMVARLLDVLIQK
jgi:DNA-binding NarL/FixJ family response regulator